MTGVSQDSVFSERMKALKHTPVLKARQVVIDNLDDVNTAKWYLERKRKEEFSVRLHGLPTEEEDDPPTPFVIQVNRVDCRKHPEESNND